MTGTQINYIKLVKSGDILVHLYDVPYAKTVLSMLRKKVYKQKEEQRPKGTYVKLFFQE